MYFTFFFYCFTFHNYFLIFLHPNPTFLELVCITWLWHLLHKQKTTLSQLQISYQLFAHPHCFSSVPKVFTGLLLWINSDPYRTISSTVWHFFPGQCGGYLVAWLMLSLIWRSLVKHWTKLEQDRKSRCGIMQKNGCRCVYFIMSVLCIPISKKKVECLYKKVGGDSRVWMGILCVFDVPTS